MKKHERIIEALVAARHNYLAAGGNARKYYPGALREVLGAPGECLVCGSYEGMNQKILDLDSWLCPLHCPLLLNTIT